MIKLKPTGTFHKQMVRCGKPNCKCNHGKLHGPYWYHFHREYLALWNEQNRKRERKSILIKTYIRKSEFKEALRMERNSRQFPVLSLPNVSELNKYSKKISKILEKSYKNNDYETQEAARNEFILLIKHVYVLNSLADEAAPAESGILDSSVIKLTKLLIRIVWALNNSSSITKFEYGQERHYNPDTIGFDKAKLGLNQV